MNHEKKNLRTPEEIELDKKPSIDELIPLREAAEMSRFTSAHVRQLVRRGKIWGIKLGRNWFTTKQAIKEYLDSDRRPGPKPNKRD